MKILMTKVSMSLLSPLVLASAVQADSLFGGVEVTSLRGWNDINETSEMIPNRRSMAVNGGIPVNFDEQPPLIPHGVDKTRITLTENSCLGCHSEEYAEEEGAVEPPKSHYRTRDGKRLKQISTGRYFCTQCHVPQAHKEPLIGNNFKNKSNLP